MTNNAIVVNQRQDSHEQETSIATQQRKLLMCIKLNRVGTLLHIHILSLTILPSPYAIQKGSSRTPLHHALLSAPLPVLHVALSQHQDALAPLHRLLHLRIITITHTHGSPQQSRQ